ncbi:MAG TPA: cytochrome c [Chryseosolibacter sp.]
MGENLIVKHKALFACSGFMLSALCFLLSCSTNENSAKAHSPKFTQYYNQGEQLYLKHCSNCHQKNGKGLGRLYPPVDSSDFMTHNFSEVICLMENGKKGSLIVNGVEYNQAMPGVPTLTDLEVAEIATYIYNSWTHQRGIVEVKEVSEILQNCNPE